MVYLDDNILFWKRSDEHMANLKTIITLLTDGGPTLKLRKYLSLKKLVEYLGHIVSMSCLHVASKTCNAVQAIQPQPTKRNFDPSSGCVYYIANSFRILNGKMHH